MATKGSLYPYGYNPFAVLGLEVTTMVRKTKKKERQIKLETTHKKQDYLI